MSELTGISVINSGATTVTNTTQQHALGTRARDAAGNEYIYVKYTTANFNGGWAVIDGDYNAGRPATTSRGPLGICQANAAVNDFGWLKIYGAESAAQVGDTEATSAYMLIAPTGATTEPIMGVTSTLATSVVSAAVNNPVFGAWIVGAVTTATTGSSSTFSGATAQVFLNYPYLAAMTVERGGTS